MVIAHGTIDTELSIVWLAFVSVRTIKKASSSVYWGSHTIFDRCFNTNALPRINIGADVWGESITIEHHDKRLLTLVLVYFELFAHQMGSV